MTPEKFLKRHGFTDTPAGDRMVRDLKRVIAQAIAEHDEKRNNEDQD